MGKKETKKKKRSKLLIALGIILIFLLLIVGTGYGFAMHYLNKIGRADEEEIVVVPPSEEDFEVDEGYEDFGEVDWENSGLTAGEVVIKPDDIQWEEPKEEVKDDNLLNVLLVGQDRREGEGRQRSDTMILCSINTKTKEVAMISFLRDLYVQIPGGYSDNRLNAPYAFGGFPLLNATLEKNFGITVDANFEVDFNGFIAIIDCLGGVDINLSAAEAKHVGEGATAGMNHLNGKQALSFARIRYIDSDFNRTERQREVLTAVFTKLRNSSVSNLLNLVEEILPYVTTDLRNDEILELAYQVLPMVGSMELNSYRVPANNEYYNARIRGMSVLVPDLKLIRNRLQSECLPLS